VLTIIKHSRLLLDEKILPLSQIYNEKDDIYIAVLNVF